jgi:hypothetical protein
MNMSINISMNSTARECMDSNWFNRLSLRVSMNWKEESEEDGWSRKGEMKFNNLYISVRVVRVCVFFISPVVFSSLSSSSAFSSFLPSLLARVFGAEGSVNRKWWTIEQQHTKKSLVNCF